MSKLSYYTNDWQRAQVVTSEFITPEDGKYRVIIESVKYAERDSEGNETDPTFIYIFSILEGAHRGERFRRFTTIRNERSAGYFKGDMQKLGLPIPANPEDLPNVFMSAPGSVLDLTVKTKNVNGKDYKDIYFDKLIGKQAPPQPQNMQVQCGRPMQGQPQAYAQRPQQYQDAPFNPNDYDGIKNDECPF